ncbi:MAG: hypothetical protein HQL37_08180 [Alphaproteobacteria bacterium]|nr:hypothetical protein [Alphaproteobacteria bacterium]
MIEVMIGVVLTAILVLGLSSVWTVVGSEFLRLTLRQKAILALNGETERLAYYYSHSTSNITSCLGNTPQSINADTNTSVSNALMYAYGNGGNSGACKVDAAHINSNVNYFDVGQVYVLSSGALPNSQNSFNLVWLDREKHLAGSLFWTAYPLSSKTCLSGSRIGLTNATLTNCQLLTVYIQYPWRFTTTTTPPTLINDVPPLDWVSVQTIVGGRL